LEKILSFPLFTPFSFFIPEKLKESKQISYHFPMNASSFLMRSQQQRKQGVY